MAVQGVPHEVKGLGFSACTWISQWIWAASERACSWVKIFSDTEGNPKEADS